MSKSQEPYSSYSCNVKLRSKITQNSIKQGVMKFVCSMGFSDMEELNAHIHGLWALG